MEQTITKDILKNELYAGQRPAVELLYTRYSGMLFSYILQFVTDKKEAGALLVNIFSRLTPRLQQAFDSSLSVYCWLQVEARKIILEQKGANASPDGVGPGGRVAKIDDPGNGVARTGAMRKADYSSLLADASPEHQWAFRELFIHGRKKEELAAESGKELAHISGVLRDCMLIIRKNLG